MYTKHVIRSMMLVVAMAVITSTAGSMWAFINPNFSPIHLIEQSEKVLIIKFEGAPKDGKATATVVKALKGDRPEKPLKFDLFAGAFEAQGEAIAKTIADGTTDAMLFVGFFQEEGGGGAPMGAEEAAKGFLHIAGKWIVMASFEEDQWDMEKIDARMLGTWAGSTDMLVRAIEYVIADEDADIPVKTNAEWDKEIEVARVDGKVRAMHPVYMTPEAAPLLYVASEAGDRLFEFKDGKFIDVTGSHKLTAKSVCSVWLDVNLDGKLDLLSCDGKTLTLHRQGDGGFAATALDLGEVPAVASLGYATKPDGKPEVFVGSPQGLMVLALEADGKGHMEKAPGSVEGLGDGGRCFVADFTGDGLPDVLQLFASGSLLYKGTEAGKLSEPVKTVVELGKGVSGACIGDFDQDGKPEVFCTAEDRNRFYQNRGDGRFDELLVDSGEISYISKPGGIDCMAGDVNNDGRVDLLIGYTAQPPQVFFNRGFRSFGHAREVDLADLKIVEQSADGQQAVCWGDFNNDGAEDMAILLKNGEMWYFPRRTAAGAALSVTAALPMGKGLAQPVTVMGYAGDRCLGGWAVSVGGPVGFIGTRDPGPVTLKWRIPGGEEQTKEILLVDKPVRFVLTDGK